MTTSTASTLPTVLGTEPSVREALELLPSSGRLEIEYLKHHSDIAIDRVEALARTSDGANLRLIEPGLQRIRGLISGLRPRQ